MTWSCGSNCMCMREHQNCLIAPRDSDACPRGRTHRKVELVLVLGKKKEKNLFNKNDNKWAYTISRLKNFHILYFTFLLSVTPFYKGKNKKLREVKIFARSHPRVSEGFFQSVLGDLLSFLLSFQHWFICSGCHLFDVHPRWNFCWVLRRLGIHYSQNTYAPKVPHLKVLVRMKLDNTGNPWVVPGT